MHRKKILSDTQEMYLKTLYDVRGKHDVARVGDLAQGLGVSPAAVTGVLKRLEQMQLVDHERYGVVALTPTGHKVAECVIRRYETIRDLLVEVLGVDEDTASVDACMMEHAVSPKTVNRMQSLLTQVRNGKVELPRRRPKVDSCGDCEVVGTCQAPIAEDA